MPDSTNPQTFNRLSYTQNNPLNRTDPTGHRDTEADVNENSSDYGLDSDWLEDFLNYVPQNKSTHIPVDTVGDIIIEEVNAPSEFLPTPKNSTVSTIFGWLSTITDFAEAMSAMFAVFGVAKGLPDVMAFGDIFFSGAGSVAAGQTGWITLPGMPEMFVIGQDLAFTAGEFAIRVAVKLGLALLGLLGGGAGAIAGSSVGDFVDFFTSIFAFAYDGGRVLGDLPTTWGIGFYYNSDQQLIIAKIHYNP